MIEDGANALTSGASVLLCLKERLTPVIITDDESSSATADHMDDDQEIGSYDMVPEYGICCVDTVVGTITVAQFQDDIQRSRLRTFLARYIPTEVLLEHNHFSQETIGTLRLIAPRAAFEHLRGDEMPSGK